MPKILYSLIVLTFAFLPAAAQQEGDFVETLTGGLPGETVVEGRMNWTERRLKAWGEGLPPEGVEDPARRRLMGLRAAKVVALRNLLELVGKIHIDSRTTVEMAMLQSDSVQARVSGILQGARVLQGSQEEKDGLYRLAVEIDLGAPFAAAVLPDSAAWIRAALPSPGHVPPPELPAAEEMALFTPPKPYTGLIVDARGLDLRPSMAPRVVGVDGRVVYGAAVVDREYATAVGAVGFDRDLDRALTSQRMGGGEAHPLVVEALEVTGLYSGDVVISNDAAVRVRMADSESRFLAECRVTFVVGPLPEALETSFSDSVDLEIMRRTAAARVEGAYYRPAEDSTLTTSPGPSLDPTEPEPALVPAPAEDPLEESDGVIQPETGAGL